jgi:hypothetical protein
LTQKAVIKEFNAWNEREANLRKIQRDEQVILLSLFLEKKII